MDRPYNTSAPRCTRCEVNARALVKDGVAPASRSTSGSAVHNRHQRPLYRQKYTRRRLLHTHQGQGFLRRSNRPWQSTWPQCTNGRSASRHARDGYRRIGPVSWCR